MQAQKCLDVRLYFNRSNMAFYINIGEHLLFMINDKVAGRIQEKEQLHIVHCNDIKEIQLHTNAPNKPL